MDFFYNKYFLTIFSLSRRWALQFYFFWHYDEIKIYRIYCLGIKIDIKGKK